MRRSNKPFRGGDAGHVESSGDSEVGKLSVPIRSTITFDGFHVTVNDARRVRVREAFGELQQHGPDFAPGIGPVLDKQLAQGRAVHEFEGDVGRAVTGTKPQDLTT